MKQRIVVNSKSGSVRVMNLSSGEAALSRAEVLIDKAKGFIRARDIKKAYNLVDEASGILGRAESQISKFKIGDRVKIKDDASVSPSRDPKEYTGHTGKVTGYDTNKGDGHWATVQFDKTYIVPASKGGPFPISQVQVHESDLKKV